MHVDLEDMAFEGGDYGVVGWLGGGVEYLHALPVVGVGPLV